ncbi:MAG: carbonic anhydrase [Chloroflexaceae bacterium]|nr:carbonic anhydrase [Chloroflexaceae bacterium]
MKFPTNPTKLKRRHLLQYSTGLIGVGSLMTWLGTGAFANRAAASTQKRSLLAAAPPSGAKTTLVPDQALTELMAGNRRFVENKRQKPHQDFVRIREVAQGQAPFAAILSCADSRVIPEVLFDRGIGDLFVVRVAGNIAITEDIASEEYATSVLGASLLMVLGHERCGAVQAALARKPLPGVIESLVFAIQPAVEASEGKPGDRLTNAVQENVRLQVRRLLTSSTIAQQVAAGKLKVVGAYYDLDTGTVSLVS